MNKSWEAIFFLSQYLGVVFSQVVSCGAFTGSSIFYYFYFWGLFTFFLEMIPPLHNPIAYIGNERQAQIIHKGETNYFEQVFEETNLLNQHH